MPRPAAPRFADRLKDLPPSGEIAALSGMENMQGSLDGRLPALPICRTLGLRLAEGRLYAQGPAPCPIFGF